MKVAETFVFTKVFAINESEEIRFFDLWGQYRQGLAVGL